MNATNGEVIWKYYSGWPAYSPPVVANGKLYICSGTTQPALLIFGILADAGEDRTAKVGRTVSFDASGSSNYIVTYEWDFGDGTTGTGETTTHTYTEPGTYIVTLKVTDAGGNWVTDTVTITVEPLIFLEEYGLYLAVVVVVVIIAAAVVFYKRR